MRGREGRKVRDRREGNGKKGRKRRGMRERQRRKEKEGKEFEGRKRGIEVYGVWVGEGTTVNRPSSNVSLAAELTLDKEAHGRTPGLGRWEQKHNVT